MVPGSVKYIVLNSTWECIRPGNVQYFVLYSTWECTVLCIVQYLGVYSFLYCTVPGSVPLTGGRPKTGGGPGSEQADIISEDFKDLFRSHSKYLVRNPVHSALLSAELSPD